MPYTYNRNATKKQPRVRFRPIRNPKPYRVIPSAKGIAGYVRSEMIGKPAGKIYEEITRAEQRARGLESYKVHCLDKMRQELDKGQDWDAVKLFLDEGHTLDVAKQKARVACETDPYN